MRCLPAKLSLEAVRDRFEGELLVAPAVRATQVRHEHHGARAVLQSMLDRRKGCVDPATKVCVCVCVCVCVQTRRPSNQGWSKLDHLR